MALVERLAENIWRIGVVLPQNPLKELNSYFIRGDTGDLLIDTGFRRRECQEALEAGLRELKAERDRCDVYLTHCHSDHAGLADLFVGKNRQIFMSRVDLAQMRDMVYGDFHMERSRRFVQEGFDPAQIQEAYDNNPARIMAVGEITDQYTGLEDGAQFQVGDYTLQMLLMPGHTPGNTMLWEARHGIMFTGDHILYDITPNITLWDSDTDYLGLYLDSLRAAAAYPVRTSYPGHRHRGDYQKRIRELLCHHAGRLEEVTGIVRRVPGLSAYEIASRMKWRFHADTWEDAMVTQKWFATGECLAHLEHLRRSGAVVREYNGNTYLYHAAGTQRRIS